MQTTWNWASVSESFLKSPWHTCVQPQRRGRGGGTKAPSRSALQGRGTNLEASRAQDSRASSSGGGPGQAPGSQELPRGSAEERHWARPSRGTAVHHLAPWPLDLRPVDWCFQRFLERPSGSGLLEDHRGESIRRQVTSAVPWALCWGGGRCPNPTCCLGAAVRGERLASARGVEAHVAQPKASGVA